MCHRDSAFVIKNLKIKWYIKLPKYPCYIERYIFSKNTNFPKHFANFVLEVNDLAPTIWTTLSDFSCAKLCELICPLKSFKAKHFNNFIVYYLVFSLCF